MEKPGYCILPLEQVVEGHAHLELLLNPYRVDHYRAAELKGSHTNMMVAIDETGHDNMTAVTHYLIRLWWRLESSS